MRFKPVMKTKHGFFVLSFDISRERTLTLHEWEKSIDFLLRVLEKYKIPATWAITGDFFFRKPYSLRHKSRSNNLNRTNFSKGSCDSFSFFGQSIIKKILLSDVGHEIGYHSFSHPVFTQIKTESADLEIRAGIEMAEHFGISLKSFVFPQDKIGHVDILKKYGLLVYRGEMLMQSNLHQRALKKVDGLINEIFAPLVIPEWKNGIWEIPSSMYFVDPKYRFSLLPRAKLGLWRAMKHNMAFHVWMHPWNLLEYESLGRDFKLFMEYVSKKRNEGKIEVRTMGDFAAYLNEMRGHSQNQN